MPSAYQPSTIDLPLSCHMPVIHRHSTHSRPLQIPRQSCGVGWWAGGGCLSASGGWVGVLLGWRWAVDCGCGPLSASPLLWAIPPPHPPIPHNSLPSFTLSPSTPPASPPTALCPSRQSTHPISALTTVTALLRLPLSQPTFTFAASGGVRRHPPPVPAVANGLSDFLNHFSLTVGSQTLSPVRDACVPSCLYAFIPPVLHAVAASPHPLPCLHTLCLSVN